MTIDTTNYDIRNVYVYNCKKTFRYCFEIFDIDRDGHLNFSEFCTFLYCVFTGSTGSRHDVTGGSKAHQDTDKETSQVSDKLQYQKDFNQTFCRKVFILLDTDQDDKLNENEFFICWKYWLRDVLTPNKCLLVVDVQNDFIDGSLSVKQCSAGQDGADVVPVINSLLDHSENSTNFSVINEGTSSFNCVIYSLDWHPVNHISFYENVTFRPMHPTSPVQKPESAKLFDQVIFDTKECPIQANEIEQTLWPAHCIQDSKGAELHPDLKIVKDAVYVYKGTNPDLDSYSAFWDNSYAKRTEITSELIKRDVNELYITGLAYDVCVGSTALHALQHGYRTIVIDNACKGVSLEGIEDMKQQLLKAGAVICDSSEAIKLMNGEIFHPKLALTTAQNIRKAIQMLPRTKNKIKS